MSLKQDRTGTRTSEDLRRRLNVVEIAETSKKVDASVEQVQKLSNQIDNLSSQVKGLNNAVTNVRESYVSTNAQTFTDEQKTRARNNIGAVGKETDPTVPSHVKNITTDDIKKWNAGAGDINEILNSICPIGKVEVFFDNNDHSNYLGFKWQRTSVGKVPVGIDASDTDFNTIGKTAGEKTHKLTIAEMPSHNHIIRGRIDRYQGEGTVFREPFDYDSTFSGTENNVNTFPTGGNVAHNNLQPYEVMAFWRRIS